MADLGTLEGLTITMKKHPSCFKLNEPLKSKNEAVTDSAVILYNGRGTNKTNKVKTDSTVILYNGRGTIK